MRLMRDTRQLFKGTDQFQMFEFVLAVVSLVSGCFAISVVPFLRKDMGERYLGWLNLFFGYGIVANFFFFGSLFGVLTTSGGSELMGMFWLAFIAMSLYRRHEINRRNNAGIPWHSMSIGTSILGLPFTREIVFKFIEPALVFFAGYLLWTFSGQVGLWLMISAVALLINNHIVFFSERQAILDRRDGEIEARYLSAALSGSPATETAGFVVAESSVRLMKQDAGLQAAFANLSPELKDVLTQSNDTIGGRNEPS